MDLDENVEEASVKKSKKRKSKPQVAEDGEAMAEDKPEAVTNGENGFNAEDGTEKKKKKKKKSRDDDGENIGAASEGKKKKKKKSKTEEDE